MDGRTVPYTWLAGYQVTIPAYSRHYRLTWTRYRQTLSLTSHEAEYTQYGWAAPTCQPQATGSTVLGASSGQPPTARR